MEPGKPRSPRETAALGFTVTVWDVLNELLVAVIDCVPAVLRVTLNVPTPLTKTLGGGKIAFGSVEDMKTVPEKFAATLPY
jgi:hypothetical protein